MILYEDWWCLLGVLGISEAGLVPICSNDGISKRIDLLGFRLHPDLGDRGSLLLFLELAAHVCGIRFGCAV